MSGIDDVACSSDVAAGLAVPGRRYRDRVLRIHGTVQHYDWGDTDFLPSLLGVPADGRPWAELWLGTHANGPSRTEDGRDLVQVAGPLPYLLKVLAAARPLSLQTHPDRTRAEAGHAAGRYPDPYAKPELLLALTRFEALCGVRPVDDTVALLDDLGITALRDLVAGHGPGAALTALYRGHLDVGAVIDACSRATFPEAVWVRRLDQQYPGQPSVAASLLLHLVELEPGEVIHLAPGNIHAYLGGCGVELMAASDNVVRGGLTSKAVDVEEFLRVADTTPLARPVVEPAARHELAGTDVALVTVPAGSCHTASVHELAVSLDGACWYLAPGDVLDAVATTYVVSR